MSDSYFFVKFVKLIKEREALYNSKLKIHHDKRAISYLWNEVAEKMGMSGEYMDFKLFLTKSLTNV